MLRHPSLLLTLLSLLALWSCSPKPQEAKSYTELRGEIFHTYYSIKYSAEADYSAEVDSTFSSFSHSLNPFDSTSLISAINRNLSTETDSMLRHVWRHAEWIARESGGSYDVTVAPLASVWGFSFDSARTVTPELLDSIRSYVGYQKVELRGNELLKADARTKIDFSSISKGYCSDLVGQLLYGRGAENYLVEIGGEIAWRGKNPRGEPWRIGINKPIEDDLGLYNEPQLLLSLDMPEGGLATSGNYRNYRIVDGKKVAHTIDPRTGYPLQTDVLSATIIAPSCMLADGLATACMTMRAEHVPAFIERFPSVEYLLIVGSEATTDEGYALRMSEGFGRMVIGGLE